MQGGEHRRRRGELNEPVGEGLGVVGDVDSAQRADLRRLASVEASSSNNSTARTRRASANSGRGRGGREEPAEEGEG